MEVLFPLQDKIRYWEKHQSECGAVNCIASVVSVMDIAFLKDYPELNIDSTIVFYHKFVYLTNVKEKVCCNFSNIDYSYIDDCICITLKCDCNNEFSEACLASNFKVLCKAVMQVIDGAYPFSMVSSFSSLSSVDSLKKEERRNSEENLDGFNVQFCKECFTPILLCSCLSLSLNKEDFLKELQVFPLCQACLFFLPECKCRYKLFSLYNFYSKYVVDNKVPKRLNELRRLAYLASCNVKVCLNCNRYNLQCICESSFRKIFPFE